MATAKKPRKRKGIVFALLPTFFTMIHDHLPGWCTRSINAVGGIWDDFVSFITGT